jgi:putative transposase
MNLCKDYKRTHSWRNTACALNKIVRVGVFPLVCGNAWKPFCPNTANLPRAVDHAAICEKSRTASITYFAPVASGRPRRRNSLPAARCIDTSRSGRFAVCFTNSGSIASDITTIFAASNGSGKVWTAPAPRLPWAGKKTGANPTDRGKLGVKRSVLTDGRGVPLGLAVDGANRHDQKLFRATLDSLPFRRPRPTSRRPQHLCCDKGFDAEVIRREACRRHFIPHIKSRGEEDLAKRLHGRRPRRWVVERVASWMNRFRRILVRWEKKAVNYEAFLHLVMAYITWKQTNCVLG